jgi:transcriptional regulator with XRE-family HTH domain
VGARIEELRKQKKLSRQQLAARLGVRYNAVSYWESGRSVPELQSLLLMVDVFDLGSIEEVLGGTLGTARLLELRAGSSPLDAA